MKITTERVHPDEPCHGLREGPRNGRWLQRVYVVRGDAVAEWVKDYGPVEDWKDATEVIYPSFGENSVAQLQELAERDRNSDKWAKRRREMQAESTLISDILKQEETLLDVVRNRSIIGPAITVQRNDFPREAVINKQKEKRNDAKRRRAS
ncbi:hypothetical protein LCGC14_1477430 [marine sediment metagenome]|uniref:Uncharacterized protein n=1 Tax=marine sediment metagenome TaxID=412755 RepID=A0A0F9MCA8_9ZZZZ